MEKIPVTVGILTYNSEKTLSRCLESLKYFRDIVIADGGSTDRTLEIAKKYNVRVIPQSQEGKPIEDFSLERNRLLDTAKEDWFFYLDSDEVVSPEFVDGVCFAVRAGRHKVYQVRYVLTSPDLSIRYHTAVPYYQPRFFSTKIGARFIKKVHEKIEWDKKMFPTGKIEGPWLVPLDTQLDFQVYKEKVDHRIPLIVAEWDPSFFGALRKGFYEPLKNALKILLKSLYLHMCYPSKELVPLRYEFYRIYSQWVIAKTVWKRYSVHHENRAQ
jgi:glycosyltransferase involved in cell wall biosynthesis